MCVCVSSIVLLGGQGTLLIDTEEVSEYAFRKGEDDMDLSELVSVAESDWRSLTGFPLKDDKCEFMCRAKYDTVGSLVVTVTAERGEDCTTCGDRLSTFINMIRDTKSDSVANGGSRKRRQTSESGSSGSILQTHLVYGNKNAQLAIWLEEFTQLSSLKPDKFKLTNVFSQGDERKLINLELIEEILSQYSNPTSGEVYVCVCGQTDLLTSVSQALLSLNVPSDSIYTFW